MACEMEKTNVELLDIWRDMVHDEWQDTTLSFWELDSVWKQACDLAVFPIQESTGEFISMIGLARFLENLESGNLTEECTEALDNWLDSYSDMTRAKAFMGDLGDALDEAKDRYAKCLHELKGGIA